VAQNTYKCGNTYSQTPCPDGVLLDTPDKRTGMQKKQVESSADRTANAADAMEKDRLAQEKRDLTGNRGAGPVVIAPAVVSADTPTSPTVLHPPKKKRGSSEFFTAQAPGESKAAKAKKLKAAKAAKKEEAAKAKAASKAAKAEKAVKNP
jgi:hypothetical protein